MKTVEDFVTLLQDSMGLPVTADDIDARFDDLVGWDSVLMVQLLGLLEQRTGRPMPLADALDAANLREIYALASE